MKEYIESVIQTVISKEFGVTESCLLEQPSMVSFGDFVTPIAMTIARHIGQSPTVVADRIIAVAFPELQSVVLNMVCADPGFINITVRDEARIESIASQLREPFSTHIHDGEAILIEHSSPNLFKPFHIGHLMNNTIGESVARLMKASGADVTTISYPSDISLGIAKAIYKILNDDKYEKLRSTSQIDTAIQYYRGLVQLAGLAYVEGTKDYEDSDEVKAKVKQVSTILYNKEIETVEYQTYLKCKEMNLAYLETVLQKTMGSHFDGFIFESEAGEVGKKLVLEHTPEIFTQSDGAIIYEGEKDGLHTRVFINSEGNPTYEAKDIGLLALKFERYTPDLSLFVTDHEQAPYFEVVQKAAGKINKDWEEKTIHLTHGRMSFRGAKMSSRLGGVPTAEEIIAAVREEAATRLRDDQKNQQALAHDIALGAIKFAILRSKPGSNINFDPDTSLSFEGDSGPYLMYTHARIQSLIKTALNEQGIVVPTDPVIPEQWISTAVEKQLVHFLGEVIRAQRLYAPHYLVTYLLALAQYYNSWYGDVRMIDSDADCTRYRLWISRAVGDALRIGLDLLGITAPSAM